MLANILDQLFGLERISLGDPRAALGWRYPLPAWAWVFIVLAAAGVAVWSYWRILGGRWPRVALAVVRGLLVLLVAALLVGPMLVISQEIVEPDTVIFLYDRSLSMRIRDMSPPPDGGTGGNEPVSRDAAVRAAVAMHPELFDPEKVGRERRTLWLGFDSATYPVDPVARDAAEPEGQTTAIRTAIDQALQRGAGQRITGIVLLTDGRSPQPTGGDLVRRLRQQGVGIYSVPLGSMSMPLDLAVGQVDAPDKAFTNDTVPVSVFIDRLGKAPDSVIDPSRVRVRLIDAQTNRVLDERSPSDPDLRQPVHLVGESEVIGPTTWRVELVYEPASGGAGAKELITDNNTRDLAIEMVDRPLGVLYVEGYPRWEYRYLRTMLLREKSVKSSILLTSADRAFAQEGQLPITRYPATAEELAPYDVIVIGDVPSSYFTPDQLTLIRDHVAQKGAGLLWIGGANDTPRSYDATLLSALLPMRTPAAVDRADPTLGALSVRPTPLAEALSVLRLRTLSPTPGETSSFNATWPANLPPLLWAQDLGELKPSAETLATSYGNVGRQLPLVSRMRYGAGQIVYVGTDETWRWRYGKGELYFEQFWMQMLRMLGRSRLEQGERAVLSVSDRRVALDQPAVVTVRINDALLAQRNLQRVAVAVTRAEDPNRTAIERLELATVSPAPGSSDGGATAQVATEFRAIWRPTVSGRLNLRVIDPALEELNLEQTVEVTRPDDELRQPLPDHDRLVALAEATGGRVVPLERLGELATVIPSNPQRTPNDIREPLWNSYFALFAVVGLLTAEWIGRKVIRLA